MKSIQLAWLVLAAALSAGSAAYARGPSGGMSNGAGTTAGAGPSAGAGGGQGTGTRADGAQAQSGGVTGTHAQVHVPGTGLTDDDPATGQARGAGVQKGIHTPGTGLLTTTTE